MRIRKNLSVVGVTVTVFSSALATTAPAMAAQSPPPSYHLSGSYVLGRTITTCLRYAQGCSTAPFPVQVTGNGKSWQIMNTSGLWDHPLSLAFGSGAWRAAGMEPESTCNGATVPSTMVTIVLKMSGTSNKGVAQQLAGTLESDQGPTVCNSGSNSIGKWSVFTSPTSIVISEMNYDNENGFRLITITKSGGGWPGAFLHIADR